MLSIFTIVLAGCTTTATDWLWQPLPQELSLKEEIAFIEKTGYKHDVTLPAGKYTFWYEDKVGYYFETENEIIYSRKNKTERFRGGIVLYKDRDMAFVYRLYTLKEARKMLGEQISFGAPKDGMIRFTVAHIPRDRMTLLDLPAIQIEK